MVIWPCLQAFVFLDRKVVRYDREALAACLHSLFQRPKGPVHSNGIVRDFQFLVAFWEGPTSNCQIDVDIRKSVRSLLNLSCCFESVRTFSRSCVGNRIVQSLSFW
jgi:hypothetical protein